MNVILGQFTPKTHTGFRPGSATSPLFGGSIFPEDAVARIFKPARSATTSGKARTRKWRLRFEPRRPLTIEPVMGWTASADTLQQIELEFPTLEAAVRHAERMGVAYAVHPSVDTRQKDTARSGRAVAAFSDATLERLALHRHRVAYREAMAKATERGDPVGGADGRSPMEVARDASLPIEARRSILMNWAYDEYLQDQASTDGMPVPDLPPLTEEIERALRALEGHIDQAVAA